MAIRFRRADTGETEVQLDGHHLRIVQLMRAAYSYKEMGARIGIGTNRVSNLQDELRRAFHLSNRRELFLWSLQHPVIHRLDWVDPQLHPVGCECGQVFCELQRVSS